MDNLTEEKLELLYGRIDRLLREKSRVLLAIDGPCTAGKSTLGQLLQTRYSCNLLHMDSFFLQPHQRTPQRLAEPGGNVDYERFLAEVLLPLQAGRPFTYRPYVCSRQALGEPVEVPPAPLTVVEGTYSQHPYFQDPYDLRVFIRIDPQLQAQRVGQREAWKQEMFHKIWIPMEQAYFQAFSISDLSDVIL